MEIKVFNNNVEKALKVAKKKLAGEGLFRELKRRRYYEKPSVRKKAKQREAQRRRQKWLSKRLMPQARKWSPDEIDRALLDLLRVDRLLKASGAADEALLEEWLLTRMVVAEERTAAAPARVGR